MFDGYRNRLAVVLAGAALVAFGGTPAAAAPAPLCTGGRVPAFESPDVTLTPEPNTSFSIWSSSVSVIAFCEDLSNPGDLSQKLSGVNVSAVTIFVSSTTAPSDLQISISKDGSGGFQTTPSGATTFLTSGITSDASGNATFIMRATTPSTSDSFLGNPDGTPRLIGMQFDVNFPDPTTGATVFPDESFVFAQTPELDSIALFGSGAVGMIGYALLRARARRRRG